MDAVSNAENQVKSKAKALEVRLTPNSPWAKNKIWWFFVINFKNKSTTNFVTPKT